MQFSSIVVLCLVVAEAEARSYRMGGDHNATRGQFPWLVTLNLRNSAHLCGGVLVTKQWVLTAAHCVESERIGDLQVVSGEHRIDQQEGSEQTHQVDKIHIYPHYLHNPWVDYMTPYINDVALLHLARPVRLDQYTKRIILDPGTFPIIGSRCREAGWGATRAGGNMSNILRYTDVPVRPLEECERAYNKYIHENALCAGSVHSGHGFCTGDNGGGLVCYDPHRQEEVLSAVLSWREGCAEHNKPAVYMDVLPYLQWFVKEIGDDIFWPEKEGV